MARRHRNVEWNIPKVGEDTATGYPAFAPGMTTAEYIKRFQQLDRTTGGTPEEIKRNRLAFTHAARAAPMLDPLVSEVLEEPDPDYAPRTGPAKRPSGGAVSALRAKVAALEAEVVALRQQLAVDLA